MKILVVDDSSTMRRIIINTLGQIGQKDVVEAGDGKEALTKLSGVDIILTDWNMPEMDGLTFVKNVRTQNKTTPIVMVTTEAAKEEIVEAIKAGVNDYVVKPFTPDVIKEKLGKLVK